MSAPGADDGTRGPDGIDWWHSEHAWASPPPRPERRRLRAVIAAMLARFGPAAGAHHATPGDAPPPVPQPREPEPGGRDPMETVLDLHWWREDRVRPYVDDAASQPGARRRLR